jgi:hypothetical protein
MVTLPDREPEWWEELPVYFKTRAAASRWATVEMMGNDRLVMVRPAPDDVRADDIAWDGE